MTDHDEDDEDDEDGTDSDGTFQLSDSDLVLFKRLAAELRRQLGVAEPKIIRSAAAAILALERLPLPTSGVQVRVGYKTPNRDGNFGWVDLALSESEIEGTVGGHFYDPAVGGDTESSALFFKQIGGGSDDGA